MPHAAPVSIDASPRVLSDLRRAHLPEVRRRVLVNVDRLLPDDRVLIRAVYEDGAVVADLAERRSVCKVALRSHIRRTVERMLSPRFLFVLEHRDEWPPVRRRVATARWLQGRKQKDVASHLRLSIHVVRRALVETEALFSAS